MAGQIVGEGPGFKVVQLEDGRTLRVPDSTTALQSLPNAPNFTPGPLPATPLEDTAQPAGQDNAFMRWVKGAAPGAPTGDQAPRLDLASVGRDIRAWASKGQDKPDVRPDRVTNFSREPMPQDFALQSPAGAAPGPVPFAPPPSATAGTGGSGTAGLSAAARVPGAGGGGATGVRGEKELKSAFEAQQKAVQEQAQLGQAKAAEMVGFQEEVARRAQEREARLQDAQKKQQEFFDREMGNYQSMAEDLRKPAAQVDPNHYWASRTTGQRIAAAIGVALAGAGGRQNQAMGFIQQAIQDDINAQRENIANERAGKQAALAAQGTYLGMARQRFADAATAESAAYAAGLEAVQGRIASLSAKYQSPELKAKADEMLGQLEQAKQEKLIAFRQQAQTNALNWAQLHLQQQELGVKALAAATKDKPGEKDAQKTVTEVEDRYQSIKANLSRVRKMIQDKGTWEATGSHNKELDGLLTEIATDQAKLLDPNSIARESEVESAKKQLVESGLLQRNATALDVLKAFEARVDSRRDIAFRVRGLTPPGGQQRAPDHPSFTRAK